MCAEIAVFVLNLSDVIFLRTVPHTRHLYVLFFAHIPFVVNHTFNATLTETLKQYTA